MGEPALSGQETSDAERFAPEVDPAVPPALRSRLAAAADDALTRLRFFLSPLRREVRAFAREMEETALAAERSRPRPDTDIPPSRLKEDRMLSLGTEPDGDMAERWPLLARFLREHGVGTLQLEVDLESDQIRDVLRQLLALRRLAHGDSPGMIDRLLGRDRVWDALASAEGHHMSCATVVLREDTSVLQLYNSYCPLAFSRAATAFMRRRSGFGDHRAFFHAAPRYALAAFFLALVPLLAALVFGEAPAPTIVLGVAVALFIAFATAVVFETIGSVQYDKEHREKQLRRRHRTLEWAYERIERDLRRARRVQRMFIPSEQDQPLPERLATAHTFIPEMAVGGDYYDLKPLGDQRVAIVFADVSGHGMSSAFITGIIKTTFEVSGQDNLVPRDFAAEVNELLERFTPPDSFAAMVVAVYDASRRELTYTNAGHYPAPVVIRRSEAELEPLEQATSLVAGAHPDTHYEQASVELQVGDKLTLCTDGIIDSTNDDGARFGIDSLWQVLCEGVHCPATELRDRIVGAVTEHTGAAPQNDDQTVLVVEVIG